eukprot:GHRQ01032405.1.p1 GENE.GHRQ01032405.1~~GHRQ01032405.1.p1  ORF type:complete len:111 (-),score=27.59 GHRQ01032405.1:366-698(-)
MMLSELVEPERGLIVNDTVKIKVEITVQVRLGRELHVETGMLWSSGTSCIGGRKLEGSILSARRGSKRQQRHQRQQPAQHVLFLVSSPLDYSSLWTCSPLTASKQCVEHH